MRNFVLFLLLLPYVAQAAFSPLYTCNNGSGPLACMFTSYQGLEFPDGTIQTTAASGTGGVSSLNSLMGALSIAAGSGISVTPSGSSITIANTGAGAGTVSSVAMTVPAFLSISGSPITSSGTLAVGLSGTALPLLNGGTGQTTKSAAFNALSPVTTTGDLIIGNGSNSNTRLAIGSSGRILTSNGTTASWAVNAALTPAGSNTQVQFNNASAFGASSDFTWNGTQLHALNINIPTNSAYFFDGGFSWFVGLNPQAIAGGWTPSHVGSTYVAFSSPGSGGSTGGWAFGNAGSGSAFEIDHGGKVWANYNIHIAGTIQDGSSVLSLDPNNRVMNDSSNVLSIDYNNRQFVRSNAAVAIDYDNEIMNDGGGTLSMDWGNRFLYDSGGTASMDYSNRVLVDSTSTPSIDFENRFLVDSSDTNALDFENRFLVDSTDTNALDWQNRILYATDGSTQNINWATPSAPVVAYTAADPTKWATSPPTDLATAIDRIAAVVGATIPIP